MAAVRLDDLYTRHQELPGEGLLCPNDNSEVNISLKGTYCTKKLPQEDPVEFLHDSNHRMTIGDVKDYIELVLQHCLLDMKLREVCRVSLCRDHIATVLKGTDYCEIASDADSVVFTLKLNDFLRAKDIWELDGAERLLLAVRHREAGTELYTSGSYVFAGIRYSKAIRCLIADNPSKEMSQLKSVCHLNLAACQLKLERYKHVVANCSVVLSVDENNIKGLYRKGLALFHLGELEEARNVVQRALSVEPKNSSCNELLKQIRVKIKEQDRKMAETFKFMFK
jgi:tetratricopeptide (TPR) repeat protein